MGDDTLREDGAPAGRTGTTARTARLRAVQDDVRRAFREFLTLPTVTIAGFFGLAIATYAIDREQPAALEGLRVLLRSHIFVDAQATSDLLGAIAAGLIGVTTLTITLLLIVVQQSASTMTAVVFDQFLRRWQNQFYFGFFIGLTINTLVTLATVTEPFNPVIGATIALAATITALYLLILLLYTTVNQMRPEEIIEAIHDHTLRARARQVRSLVSRTRREPAFAGAVAVDVLSEQHGFVTRIDVDGFERALAPLAGRVEIRFTVSVGAFVGHRDVIARVAADERAAADSLRELTLRAVHLERQRDISLDPASGIEQLELLAWTSISTSKSNPGPGLRTIYSLHDILARWSEIRPAVPARTVLPIVYHDDVVTRVLDAFETFAVVSSESMQHQVYIAVVRTFTTLLARLEPATRARAVQIVRRILPALGDHVLTAELELALQHLAAELRRLDERVTAELVERAVAQLARSVGTLASRSTRTG